MGEIIQQHWLDISTEDLPWDELHLDPSFFPISVIRVIIKELYGGICVAFRKSPRRRGWARGEKSKDFSACKLGSKYSVLAAERYHVFSGRTVFGGSLQTY